MTARVKHRRSLLAAAMAAAPIGAHAVDLPSFTCNSSSHLQDIVWPGSGYVDGNGAGISVTANSGSKFSPGLPFSCSSLGVKTKMGIGSATVSPVDVGGKDFSINFGNLSGLKSNNKVRIGTSFNSFSYSYAGKTKTSNTVTDFNLSLTATSYNKSSGKLSSPSFEDYLGVQVVSRGSAISPLDAFYFDSNHNLIFDSRIPGGIAQVELFSSPFSSPVPEPSSAAMISAGVVGISAMMRRRRKKTA